MKNKELKKVSINELIDLASYSIEETIVPPYAQIVENFSATWADIYLDEDLKEQEGKHCFIIWDDCNNSIRAIVVSEELNENVKMLILDIMDNVIFDIIYPDLVEQLNREGIADSAYSPRFHSDYEELLNYIDSNEQAMEVISEYLYSWLQVFVNNRFDLVTL